jgi:hypothetical protein
LQKSLDHILEILRVTWWDWWILALNDFIVETLHVSCPKRWVESTKLIKNTSHAPNITLIIVGFILPYFWAGVVRCACLRVKETSFCDFGDI